MQCFNVGERARIKEGFYNIRRPNDPGINSDMKAMIGQEDELRDVTPSPETTGGYVCRFVSLDWSWDSAWLEPAVEFCGVEDSEFMNLFKE